MGTTVTYNVETDHKIVRIVLCTQNCKVGQDTCIRLLLLILLMAITGFSVFYVELFIYTTIENSPNNTVS